VEAVLRASAGKKTAQIFTPTVGLVFDSLEEAFEFYNLYSWEVGFGIRYGINNTNKGNKYKTKQVIECGNAVSLLSPPIPVFWCSFFAKSTVCVYVALEGHGAYEKWTCTRGK
jgi:hypothetical protein